MALKTVKIIANGKRAIIEEEWFNPEIYAEWDDEKTTPAENVDVVAVTPSSDNIVFTTAEDKVKSTDNFSDTPPPPADGAEFKIGRALSIDEKGGVGFSANTKRGKNRKNK